MIHYCATFFVLEKLGAAVGVSNLHIYAAMRGQTLEEFQKTGNVSVQYSFAGGENAAKLSEFADRQMRSPEAGKAQFTACSRRINSEVLLRSEN